MSKEVVSKRMPTISDATKWRFWGKVELKANLYVCWNWTANTIRGYGRFCVIPEKGVEKNIIATRLAYFLHYEIDPVGKAVLHKCDNPSCCNPHHLFLGTNKENTADMFKKKRANPPKGDEHWGAKLTAEKVIEIRNKFAEGTSKRDLEKSYSVDPGQMSRILNRKAWKHV